MHLATDAVPAIFSHNRIAVPLGMPSIAKPIPQGVLRAHVSYAFPYRLLANPHEPLRGGRGIANQVGLARIRYEAVLFDVLIRQRPRFHAPAVVGQDEGVDPVGLGELAAGFRELPDLLGVHLGDWQPCRQQGRHDKPFIAASRLEDQPPDSLEGGQKAMKAAMPSAVFGKLACSSSGRRQTSKDDFDERKFPPAMGQPLCALPCGVAPPQ